MNKWHEAHAYIAEWICAYAVVWAACGSVLKASKSVIVAGISYLVIVAFLISLHLAKTEEASKEILRNLAIILVACVILQSLSKADESTLPA